MGKKKLNEITKVSTAGDNDHIVMNTSEGSTVQIKKADLANAMADVMRVASNKKNGLMSSEEKGKSGSKHSTGPVLILNTSPLQLGKTISMSMFISYNRSGGARQNLYFVSVNRLSSSMIPEVLVKVLAGDYRVKVKYIYDETGNLTLFMEDSGYTMGTFVQLLNNPLDIKLTMSGFSGDLSNAYEAIVE
ncbi:MAG: hypothetical protein LUF85_04150 [Bacteroides sp.]|nr:hypothetical protein [Bacteroides sp.]